MTRTRLHTIDRIDQSSVNAHDRHTTCTSAAVTKQSQRMSLPSTPPRRHTTGKTCGGHTATSNSFHVRESIKNIQPLSRAKGERHVMMRNVCLYHTKFSRCMFRVGLLIWSLAQTWIDQDRPVCARVCCQCFLRTSPTNNAEWWRLAIKAVEGSVAKVWLQKSRVKSY